MIKNINKYKGKNVRYYRYKIDIKQQLNLRENNTKSCQHKNHISEKIRQNLVNIRIKLVSRLR